MKLEFFAPKSLGWEERKTMKASKFSDAQKAFILKQGADGVPVADVCRRAGISQATYFSWKKKYEGLAPLEMRRLKQLEDENTRLKSSSRTSRWTGRCCRIIRPKIDPPDRFLNGLLSAEKSEAWSQARARRHDVWRVAGVDPPGLCGPGVRSVHLPIQILPTRPGPIGGPHQDVCEARVRYGYRRVQVLLRREG
ncbi:hypothetical protein FHS55_003953 [Angulomicrobium tetraedrale]|uniref:Transposase n=1 Tax=Ancylobacter tetraedralis TaxID=217068 RepID=A0A839ZEK7_9HYPH|nr:hypothetical protein [Ancylobacter tetraedralis]